jgi:hypothetical protein
MFWYENQALLLEEGFYSFSVYVDYASDLAEIITP